MQAYYQLVIADEERWHVEVEGDEAPLDIWACNWVEMPPSMRFSVNVDGRRVDYGHTGWAAIPVISRRMADSLNSIAPDDIQRLPASVAGEADGEWEVLNVLARPDCICHQKSNITYYPDNHPDKPGKPRGVIRLIIDADRVPGHHVFRPKDWEIALVVSDDVKSLLEVLGISGVEYWPVTE